MGEFGLLKEQNEHITADLSHQSHLSDLHREYKLVFKLKNQPMLMYHQHQELLNQLPDIADRRTGETENRNGQG